MDEQIEIARLRARIAELEREKEAVEGFAAVAAHELLTPVVMMDACAATLSDRLDDGRYHLSNRRNHLSNGRNHFDDRCDRISDRLDNRRYHFHNRRNHLSNRPRTGETGAPGSPA